MNEKKIEAAIANGIFYGGLKLSLVIFIAWLFEPYVIPYLKLIVNRLTSYLSSIFEKVDFLNFILSVWGFFVIGFIAFAMVEFWNKKRKSTSVD